VTEEIIEDSGIVKEVRNNSVVVEIERGGGCKSCSMHGFCMKNVTSEIQIQTDLPLEPGDKVQLDISAVGRVWASLLIFGLPLAMLFMGFLVANIWLSELISILLGFTCMGLGFVIVRCLDGGFAKKLNIRIARKI
jgi:positive regulator of sigma E activity